MCTPALGWLRHENYIVSFGAHPAERVMLTEKGQGALNAIAKGLSATVGSLLVTTTEAVRSMFSGRSALVLCQGKRQQISDEA
jgi:hypothetical protein